MSNTVFTRASLQSLMNPVHIVSYSLFKIHFNIFPSAPRSSKWFLSVRFSEQNPDSLLSPVLVKCPAHPILLELMMLLICSDEYTFWSLSLSSCLSIAVASSHLGSNVLLSTLLSNTLNCEHRLTLWQGIRNFKGGVILCDVLQYFHENLITSSAVITEAVMSLA